MKNGQMMGPHQGKGKEMPMQPDQVPKDAAAMAAKMKAMAGKGKGGKRK